MRNRGAGYNCTPSSFDQTMELQNSSAGRTAAWGNNDLRPELQTLSGRFLRRLTMQLVGTTWVFGLVGFVVLWMLSLYHIGRWVVTQADTPLSRFVPLFLSCVAVYEGYHYITRPSRHQWPWMRQLARDVISQYPYFRLNVTVFEERLKVDADGKGTANQAASACKAIEKNDMAPFVRPNDHALFAFHPHGVLPCGWSFGGLHHPSFEQANCRWIVANNLFYFPIMRDLLNWMDCTSAAKASVRKVLETGQNTCLMPGGFEEATLYARGKHRVYIKQRFGFIKLALQHGYKVHPIYTFGEEYAYYTFPYLLKSRLKLNKFKIPGTFFFGRPDAFHLPRTDIDLITVVGMPLRFPRIDHPSREDVKKYHGQYVTALQELFDRYKGVYAVNPEATLEIY